MVETTEKEMPRFFKWRGGSISDSWSFGYLTGKDQDLICIKSDTRDEVEAEILLSPVCSNRPLAILAFVLKRNLLKLDENMKVRKLS